MIKRLRELRIVPIVLVATICLLVLKTFGLVFEGGYTLGDLAGPKPDGASNASGTSPKQSWAKQVFNFPNGKSPDDASNSDVSQTLAPNSLGSPDITGSVDETKAAAAAPNARPAGPAGKPGEAPAKIPDGKVIPVDTGRPQSASERAILERLQERRGEIEGRERDLDMRENLLKAAEKRLEERISDLKALEARISDATVKKDEVEATRFKNLVSMYENMKPKDAAKIFDHLDARVLLDMSSQINPRKMSDILAQMAPDSAERLTEELAKRFNAKPQRTSEESPAALPKIVGKPIGN